MHERILVAYASKHGATAEIAEAIAETLRASGVEVDLTRARDVRSVEPYAAVVLGSAVYMARWRGEALRLLHRRRRQLADRELWLFSSGPVGEQPTDGAKAERWIKPTKVQRLAVELGANDHAVFGGSLAGDHGGMLRRNMAKGTPEALRDLRDWDDIRAWAEGIAAAVKASTAV